MSITNLSIEQLKEAIVIKRQIVSLHEELAKLVWDKRESLSVAKNGRKELNADDECKDCCDCECSETTTKAAKPVKKAKRKLSPEGRARIVAALKKRRAGKKK